MITRVSETIRKVPLSEAQTTLGKQNIHSVERRISVPLLKFCEKLLPHAKFHCNWAISCWVMARNDF